MEEMDTNVINQRARQMYHQLGYEEIGIVGCVFNDILGVKLVCLEKSAYFCVIMVTMIYAWHILKVVSEWMTKTKWTGVESWR